MTQLALFLFKIKINFIIFMLLMTDLILAKTSLQPPFEDPFDTGSGGASLTRGTQEGILFNNPAELAYGGKAFRWLGTKVIVGGDVQALQSLGTEENENPENNSEEEDSIAELVDSFNKSPIHAKAGFALSLLTSNFGLALFSSVEPDFKTYPAGNLSDGIGVPSAVVSNKTHAGAILGLASKSPWRSLSFGLNLKYFLLEDTNITTQLIGLEALESAQAELAGVSEKLSNPAGLSTGAGADISSLYFSQGKTVDFRFAAVVENVGGMALTGSQAPIPQMLHAGLGLTFHTKQDAIHFAVDYRDITSQSNQPLFKKVYAGTKVLVRKLLALGAGMYQGSPSYGVELDLFVLRVSAAQYTLEYGDSPGTDSRNVTVISTTTGFSL